MRQFSLRDLDWVLIIIALAISAMGVLQIYSATLDTSWKSAWWKQIIFIAVGLAIMWLAAAIDYHSLMGKVPLLYLLSLVTLVAVLLIGTKIFGSRRWIPVFGFTFQISEFVKLVLILLVARFLTELRSETLEGSALTYLPILAIGVYLAGLRREYLVVAGLLAVFVLPISLNFLEEYQKARLVSFLNPAQDPRGTGYQTIQSKIAVGAGGIWGQGVAKGTQTQLRFLPVPHTDFIFSAFAEEHGFVGVVIVLALYFVLLMQIAQNAQTAPDRAGMFICMGVVEIGRAS